MGRFLSKTGLIHLKKTDPQNENLPPENRLTMHPTKLTIIRLHQFVLDSSIIEHIHRRNLLNKQDAPSIRFQTCLSRLTFGC